jgi:hypothetical protein
VSRNGNSYRRVAKALIREGDGLAENGRDLGYLEDGKGGRVDEEARIRELAGALVSGVGHDMMRARDHEKVMRKIRKIGSHIRASIRRSR